jgi:hypothetical protein
VSVEDGTSVEDDGVLEGGTSMEDEALDGSGASEGVLERVGMADDAGVAIDDRAGDADAKDEVEDTMLEMPGAGVGVVAMTSAEVIDADPEGTIPELCGEFDDS